MLPISVEPAGSNSRPCVEYCKNGWAVLPSWLAFRFSMLDSFTPILCHMSLKWQYEKTQTFYRLQTASWCDYKWSLDILQTVCVSALIADIFSICYAQNVWVVGEVYIYFYFSIYKCKVWLISLFCIMPPIVRLSHGASQCIFQKPPHPWKWMENGHLTLNLYTHLLTSAISFLCYIYTVLFRVILFCDFLCDFLETVSH